MYEILERNKATNLTRQVATAATREDAQAMLAAWRDAEFWSAGEATVDAVRSRNFKAVWSQSANLISLDYSDGNRITRWISGP